MTDVDISVGWINLAGQLFSQVDSENFLITNQQFILQDRYAIGNQEPVIDNTTTDWFALQGIEQDGWTAIQFKRKIDTCDSMDVPIKVTQILHLFAHHLIFTI